MKYSAERILTTHAGSLPRDAELVALQVAAFNREAVDEAGLREAIERSTRGVIARQIQCGVDIGNNGEHSRESFFTYVQVSGVDQTQVSGLAGLGEPGRRTASSE